MLKSSSRIDEIVVERSHIPAYPTSIHFLWDFTFTDNLIHTARSRKMRKKKERRGRRGRTRRRRRRPQWHWTWTPTPPNPCSGVSGVECSVKYWRVRREGEKDLKSKVRAFANSLAQRRMWTTRRCCWRRQRLHFRRNYRKLKGNFYFFQSIWRSMLAKVRLFLCFSFLVF